MPQGKRIFTIEKLYRGFQSQSSRRLNFDHPLLKQTFTPPPHLAGMLHIYLHCEGYTEHATLKDGRSQNIMRSETTDEL